MNYRELFLSDEFSAYRREVIKAAVLEINDMLENSEADQITGAMRLLNKIIKLPGQLCKSEEVRETIKKMLTEDFSDLTVRLVREKLQL